MDHRESWTKSVRLKRRLNPSGNRTVLSSKRSNPQASERLFLGAHAALIFAALFVALIVVGELKDILLCSMAIAHAGDKLSAAWRHALILLLGIR